MPTAVDTATEMFQGIDAKIEVIYNDYLEWWTTDMELARPRIQVLKEAQDFAQQKFEEMSLGELDNYSSQVDSWLPVINAFIPPLERYHTQIKALVGRIYFVAGFKGDPYKNQVDGDTRVAKQYEVLRTVQQLAMSIVQQSKSIIGRNYRIGAEIKAGIWAGTVQNIGGKLVPKTGAESAPSFRQH